MEYRCRITFCIYYSNSANPKYSEVVAQQPQICMPEMERRSIQLPEQWADGSRLKSEFILFLCEMAVDTGVLSAKEKSLIDRYIASTYKSYPEEPFHIVLFDIAIQAPPPIAPFFKNNLQLKGNCDIIEVN